jgi:hypothetical protein
VLYLLSVVESTEPKQAYSGKLGFFSESTIKDIIIIKRLFRGPSTNDMKK